MLVMKVREIICFFEVNNQIVFIKLVNNEISKIMKYKNDIGKMENMEYR